jgi:hypothetical protein
MARPYSSKFLLELDRANPKRLGVQLAKMCVEANLPISYVAQAFNVSRMSVHSWFRGSYIRDKNCSKIELFMDAVSADLKHGGLPAPSHKYAKLYIETVVKDKLKRSQQNDNNN